MQKPNFPGSTNTPKQSLLPSIRKNQSSQQEIKTITTISKTVTLPVLQSVVLQIDEVIKEAKEIVLHAGVYDGRAVVVQRLSAEAWVQHQETWTALYCCQSPFWLPLIGTCESPSSRVLVMSAPLETRFVEWLTSTGADAWPLRCRLMRDVAIGLYQRRAASANHIAWDMNQLLIDKAGRAQLTPFVSETPIGETDEVYALGKLIWQMVSRKMTWVEGWQHGKGLPRDCPPAVAALIQACTNLVVTERPSLKALAKGLDLFWQRAVLGFSDAMLTLPGARSPAEKEKKYDPLTNPSSSRLAQEIGGLYTALQPASASTTSSVSQSLTDSVLGSGSLSTLLIDDQTVSWLTKTDPRYQVGLKLCALRDSLGQPTETKASQPKLQAEIQHSLIESNIEMLLWVGEEGEDPSHFFSETAWRLWQAPEWQDYRPGDPPPSTWLPLFIHLAHSGGDAPLFTRHHRLTTDKITDFTETEWQVIEQYYRPFWLVQGMYQFSTLNLYDANELHRTHGQARLLLHSTPSQVFKLEESTALMPHSAEGELHPSRYARYTIEDLSTWEGRYQGAIGLAAQTTIAPDTAPLPFTLIPEKDLALHQDQLILLPESDSKSILGQGAFGKVLWATYRGQPVAVKQFKEAKLSASDQAQLKDEAAVMANLQSPFLIGLLGLSLDSPPLLVMELAQGGSLYHLLKDLSQDLPWSQRLRLLRDTALGLSVLHAHELLHRDLKSLNILLDSDGRARLCDFGLSTLKSQAKETREVGTLLWNAPEVLAGKAATPASDIYSFAIVCWEVAARRVPYQTLSWKNEVVERVQQDQREIIPSDCPPELALVIRACWAQDPSARPSAIEVAQVLEGLWQTAVIVEQPTKSSRVRQPSLDSKHLQPLTPPEPVLSIRSKTTVSSSHAGENFPSLITEETPIELFMTHIASVEMKENTPQSQQALDPAFKSLSPEMLSSLMPNLIKEGAFAPVEKKGSSPLKRDQPSVAPISTRSTVTEFKILLTKNPAPCWQDKLSPLYTLGVKLQHLRQGVLLDPYITQELACFISPNGQSQPGQLSDSLYPWVERELLKSPVRVLVLFGLAGAGKSTFNRYLLRTLWQDSAWQSYRIGDPLPNNAHLPIWIPLGSSQVKQNDLWSYCQQFGFTHAEIACLRQHAQLIFIADGYDEIPGGLTSNLFDLNFREDKNTKLIIGCRSQRLHILSEAEAFAPHQTAGGLPDWMHYRSRYVAPFTTQQTENYIDKYVAQHQNDPDHPKDWNTAHYKKEFAVFPEFQTLIDTPFMLWMTLSILPQLTGDPATQTKDSPEEDIKETKEIKESKPVRTKITRADLYDRFMEIWFSRQARKAWQQRSFLQNPASILGKEQMQALKIQAAQPGSDDVQVHWLKASYRLYCLRLAEQLIQAGKVSLSLDREIKEAKYSNDKSIINWRTRLLGDSPDSKSLRQGSPLRVGSDASIGFMHASLLDYFMSAAIAKGLLLKPEEKASEAFALTYAQAIVLLTHAHLSFDQANFLIDRVKTSSDLQRALFSIIERSKTDPFIAIGSANAATALNYSDVLLSHQSWDNVRLPGADLSYSILGGSDLRNAFLKGVRLRHAVLNGANLEGADLTDVDWGEQPSIELEFSIDAIAHHPIQPWIAVTQNKTVTIYHRNTGQLIITLAEHNGIVKNIAFSLDGKLLASVSAKRTISLWNVAKKSLYKSFTGHKADIESVTFNHQGNLLATGSKDRTVCLWDITVEKPVGIPFIGHTDWVKSVVFSPDGKLMASGSEDGTIRIWSLDSKKLLSRPLQGNIGEIQSIAFSSNGKLLAAGSKDHSVGLWNVDDQKFLGKLNGHTDAVYSVVFSPKGRLLASAGKDRTIWLWDILTQKPVQEPLTGHIEEIRSLVFSPDGELLISGSRDQNVRLWVMARRQDLSKQLDGHTHEINSIRFSPDGAMLASSGKDRAVRLWDTATGKFLYQLPTREAEINDVVFSPNGKLLAMACSDTTVQLWNVTTRQLIKHLVSHKGNVTSLAFSFNGLYLASGSYDQTVRLWDVMNLQFKGDLLTDKRLGRVNDVAFSPDGKLLASAGELSNEKTNSICVWEMGSRKIKLVFQSEKTITCITFNPNSQLLFASSKDFTISIFPLIKREKEKLGTETLMTGHNGAVESIVFSPNGKLFVSGSRDKTVRLRDSSSNKCIQIITQQSEITSIAFSSANIPKEQASNQAVLALADSVGVISFWKVSQSQRHCRVEFFTMSAQPRMMLSAFGAQLKGSYMSQQSQYLLMQAGANVKEIIITDSKSTVFDDLFKRHISYANSYLLNQAYYLATHVHNLGTQQRYLAKLNYYCEHINTLNKSDRKKLKELVNDLQRLHDYPTSTASTSTHSTLAERKHPSKLSFGLKHRLWSSPKPKTNLPITSSSSASSSSSSSSRLLSGTSSSRSATTSSSITIPAETHKRLNSSSFS